VAVQQPLLSHLALALIAACGARSSALPSRPAPDSHPREVASLLRPAEPLDLASYVTTGRLANGLSYFVVTDNDREIGLAIDAGRLHEDDGHSGVAALIPRALIRAIDPIHPEDHRVSTSTDADTSTIEISRVDDLGRDMQRMRGWLGAELDNRVFAEVRPSAQPVLSEADLIRIRSREKEDNARLAGTRLIRHPPRGLAEDDRRLDVEALRQFRQRWYAASRMTLVVTGPWRHEVVVAEIEKQFATMEDRPTPPDPPLVERPRDITVADGCCYLQVSFLVEAPPPHSLAEMRATRTRELFERAVESRLKQATRPWHSQWPSVSGGKTWLTRQSPRSNSCWLLVPIKMSKPHGSRVNSSASACTGSAPTNSSTHVSQIRRPRPAS